MENISLDQLFRDHQPFKDKQELTVIDEKGNDLIVMAPTGDTHYMTKQEYDRSGEESKY